MKIWVRQIGSAAVVAATVSAGDARAAHRQAPAAAAQQPPLGGQPGDAPAVSPGEVQRLFDAYALMQAEEQLKLSDDQLGQFMSRMKALQEVRRRNQGDRGRLLNDLRTLLKVESPDEVQIKDRLKALRDLDTRSETEIHRAYDGLDQVLDAKQQARFRVFEEVMERRKLELLTRARQANRQAQQKK